jgi:hypothetical protein
MKINASPIAVFTEVRTRAAVGTVRDFKGYTAEKKLLKLFQSSVSDIKKIKQITFL